MKDIVYNKKILDVLKELSDSLIKEFIVRKIDDSISIKVKEQSLSINVDFSTPVSNFDIEGSELAFAENVYSEFYKFFNLFKAPLLKQDGSKLILKENNQTIKFSTSNSQIIKNEFKGVKNLPEPLVSFNLSNEQFSSIEKMIKMLDCKGIQFLGHSGTNILKIVISNNVNENSSDISIELKNTLKEAVDIFINPIIFQSAPNLNYVVQIIPQAKMFYFSSVNEDFTLNLYTGLKSGE